MGIRVARFSALARYRAASQAEFIPSASRHARRGRVKSIMFGYAQQHGAARCDRTRSVFLCWPRCSPCRHMRRRRCFRRPRLITTPPGSPLQGAHDKAECAACHVPGRPTRGLQRECNTCHLRGGMRAATGQPVTHIPTPPLQSCLDCHNQNAWSPTVMRHTGQMNGQCARCHNALYASQGAQAPPVNHIPTSGPGFSYPSCDSCHRTGYSTWAGGNFHKYSGRGFAGLTCNFVSLPAQISGSAVLVGRYSNAGE